MYEKLKDLVVEYPELHRTRRVGQVLDELSDDPDATTLRLSAMDDDGKPWPVELQSTEDNFKKLLECNSVRYLIFAGHGLYHDKHPDNSGIIFNLAPPAGLIEQG